MFLQLDASDTSTLTLSGSDVSEWRDKITGARFRPGQAGATATGIPTYVTGTYPYVYFNNTSGGLSSSTIGLQLVSGDVVSHASPSSSITIYAAVTLPSTATYNGLSCMLRMNSTSPGRFLAFQVHNSTNSNDRFCQLNFSTPNNTSFVPLYAANTFVTNTKYVVTFQVSAPVGAFVYRNGQSVASTTTGIFNHTTGNSTVSYSPISLCGGYDVRSANMQIHEIQCYPIYHTTAQRRTIEQALVAKWGISGYSESV